MIPNRSNLQKIVRRILEGESTAIVGEPHFGKTSLLKYLYSPAVVHMIDSLQKEWKLIFQLIDYDLLQSHDIDPEEFWKNALMPIYQYVKDNNPSAKDAYENCISSKFSSFSVDKLFSILEFSKIRLVLFIDEFDDMLLHPFLGKKEFLGALRSLATWKDSLAIVITTRSTVKELNEHTKRDIHRGSPYFNHFLEMILGPFSPEAFKKLLSKAGNLFTEPEKFVLLRFADHNPHFLQIAAHTLWDAYLTEKIDGTDNRLKLVWKHLCRQSSITLEDAWNYWTLRTKEVLAIVIIDDMPRLIENKGFETESFRSQLGNCTVEIEFLEDRGYIKNSNGKYIISSQVLAWWLTNKITTSIQNQDEFGKWLMANQREGVLTGNQRDSMKRILMSLGNILRDNSDVFIKVILDRIMSRPL